LGTKPPREPEMRACEEKKSDSNPLLSDRELRVFNFQNLTLKGRAYYHGISMELELDSTIHFGTQINTKRYFLFFRDEIRCLL